MRKTRIGHMKQAVQESRAARAGVEMVMVWQDVRFALRTLMKSPGFTAVIVVTLALGIGANTSIFTLVNAVLLQSIPVERPEQLIVPQWSAHNWPKTSAVYNSGDCWRDTGPVGACYLSFPMFTNIKDRRDLFASATAFAGPATLDLAGNGQAGIATAELVSGDYFETLGVRPAVGRTLIAADDQNGAAPVAVLDYAYWQGAFGGNPDVVGRAIRLNNVLFTIVGVADQSFTRLAPGWWQNLYVPLTQGKVLGLGWAGDEHDSKSWWLTVVARLRPGVKRTQAGAAVDLLFRNATTHGADPAWETNDDPRMELAPAQQGLVGFRPLFSKPLLLLEAAVALVLLIACANVAGLMLVRSTSREREMAVRFALGASRSRVIRLVLTESLLLALLGAAVGALLAYVGAHALVAFTSANWFPLRINVQPDTRVLLFTIGAGLATGIVSGMAPAVRVARMRAAVEFHRGTTARWLSATHAGRARRLGLGGVLVVVQVGLSIVMLTSAGLMLRTLGELRSVDPGFDTRNLLLMWIDPSLAGYNKAHVESFYEDLQQRLAALPGVESASYSSDALLDGSLQTLEIRVDREPSKQSVKAQVLMVGPQYFTTMRLPVLRGRSLSLPDVRGGLPVALVNEVFVREFLNGRDPIGRYFASGHQQWEIVGVLRNAKYDSLTKKDKPTVYFPLINGPAVFALRTDTPPATLIPAVRKTAHDLDENVPVIRVQTQSEVIDQGLFVERLLARVLGVFSGLGVGLACIGLYGLVSYETASRTQEIGVRTALGAQQSDVLWLFLRQGVMVMLLGLAVGVGAAALATQLLTSMLYGVKPLDPGTFIAVPILLFGIGLAASLLPAARAARVDPAVALRSE